MNKQLYLRLFLVLALFLAGPWIQANQPGSIKYTARLVWGTDGDKPEDPNLKPLDQKLAEKFKGIFKWKNYFQVSEHGVEVQETNIKKVKLSSKCDIEINNLGKDTMEVKFFGEGKQLRQVKKTIKPGEVVVLAGDDKNDTAWFVILSRD